MALKWVHLKLKSRLAWVVSIATETNKKVFLYCLPFSWHLHPRVNTLYYKVSVYMGFLGHKILNWPVMEGQCSSLLLAKRWSVKSLKWTKRES